MSRKHTLLVALLTLLLPVYGCQVISASITSPTDWISGTGRSIGAVFEGISTSSGSGGKDAALMESYRGDLRQYTAAFVQSGGTEQDFMRGVTRIAENHGVANWEAEASTPFAIGQGMRLGNVSEPEMQAFCREFGTDATVAKLAFEGWQSAGG